MNIVKVILLVCLLSFSNNIYAQYSFRYSIDIKETKNRRVALKEKIKTTKEQAKSNLESNKKHRIQNRDSRKVRKHTYKIQNKKVKKRMKRSKKKAENYNNNKIPLIIKFKQFFDG